MEEMSRFQNKVKQARQKHDKREENAKIDSHKLDKRHKPDKRQPLLKGPRHPLGAYFYKTQGISLVCSLATTTTNTIKDPSSTKRTTTRLFGKTFNQVEVILTPHNNQGRSFVGQNDPSPDWVTRPSIRPPRSYLYIDKVLLPTPSKDSTLIIMMAYSYFHK
ncbi:hypothetical protein JHK82_018881 [Glycine max]|nr:hypothetical protein JHK85_019323 [Glycine max]KAG5038062.1 hypothetical protein JHK86_018902 [Glycine max]KAG5143186.1 hypothetical protein JHK82_018881 [Glycine max]